MGRALTVEECLKQAHECMTLAESTSDPELREQYLKLAQNLQELAAVLSAMQAIGSDDPGRTETGKNKSSSGAGRHDIRQKPQ